jgi:hypothetical protein
MTSTHAHWDDYVSIKSDGDDNDVNW